MTSGGLSPGSTHRPLLSAQSPREGTERGSLEAPWGRRGVCRPLASPRFSPRLSLEGTLLFFPIFDAIGVHFLKYGGPWRSSGVQTSEKAVTPAPKGKCKKYACW